MRSCYGDLRSIVFLQRHQKVWVLKREENQNPMECVFSAF